MTESVQAQVALDLFDQPRRTQVREEQVDALELLLDLVGQLALAPVVDLEQLAAARFDDAADLRVHRRDDVAGAVRAQDVDGLVFALAARHVAGRADALLLRSRGGCGGVGGTCRRFVHWCRCHGSPLGRLGPCRHGQGAGSGVTITFSPCCRCLCAVCALRLGVEFVHRGRDAPGRRWPRPRPRRAPRPRAALPPRRA